MTEGQKKYLKWLGYTDNEIENQIKEEDVIRSNQYESFMAGLKLGGDVWHYVTDKLPPNPKENEDGISVQPLNYICAYDCGDDGCGGIDYECDEFMYMGNGEWLGENKKYPIYAWLEHSVEVPKPRKED